LVLKKGGETLNKKKKGRERIPDRGGGAKCTSIPIISLGGGHLNLLAQKKRRN